jgi:hypothetical protein
VRLAADEVTLGHFIQALWFPLPILILPECSISLMSFIAATVSNLLPEYQEIKSHYTIRINE